MAKTINEAFSEFMQNSVDLDPKDVVTARYSRDNLLENIGELDCRGFFRLYPDVNIQVGSFARKTNKRPLDHVPEKNNVCGLTVWERKSQEPLTCQEIPSIKSFALCLKRRLLNVVVLKRLAAIG